METIDERASATSSGEPAATAHPAGTSAEAASDEPVDGGVDGGVNAAVGTASTEGFLAVVGARVRHQRTLVHMSRRRLAERSGVSERYLAQLETGRGNMSIVLLRKVALALGLPLAELVAE